MRQFCEAVEQQIHLRNEADHNRRFQQNFAGDPDVRFPRLVREACSDAVLTMEFVEGVRRQGLGKLQITLEIGRLFDILRRHRIQARSHMTMVNLALMTAEGLGKRLTPELSVADAAIPYLAEAVGRAVPPATAPA